MNTKKTNATPKQVQYRTRPRVHAFGTGDSIDFVDVKKFDTKTPEKNRRSESTNAQMLEAARIKRERRRIRNSGMIA